MTTPRLDYQKCERSGLLVTALDSTVRGPGPKAARAAVQGSLFGESGWEMRAAVLGSGSSGNAVVVESGGRRVLIDAGFSCRQLERRLELLGCTAASLDAVFITHEHSDHVCGLDVLARRYRMPIYATEGTLAGLRVADEVAERIKVIASGKAFDAGGFRVEAFAVPHDSREPVGFVLEDPGGRRLGLAGDLGTRSQLAWGRLCELDTLILEANHDLQMLRNGPYPWALKQRVSGRQGHLSNREAAQGLADLLCDRLRHVVLYHLSRTNNLPELAADVIGARLAQESSSAEVVISYQDRPTEWIRVGA